MIQTYLKLAWRNLRRHKGFSLLNVMGLSTAMAIVILISLWIRDELTFNKTFANYDRIVQVRQNSTHNNTVHTYTSIPFPVAVAFRNLYGSDFKRVSMSSYNDPHTLAFGDKKLNKTGLFVQPDMPDMLSLDMVSGTRNLNSPNAILISQSLALALFGKEDLIGKPIKVDNQGSLKVGGVFRDFPYASEFSGANYLGSWAYYVQGQRLVRPNLEVNWADSGEQLFAQLQDGVDVGSVSARVLNVISGHGRKDEPKVLLYPMNRWHLYEDFAGGINTGGSIQFVWMFGIIAVFVLLLACINFMNLSTARSEKRAKEVGIRKAIGSYRKQLIGQFLGESLVMAFLSFFIALALAWLCLPWFNQLSGKQMTLPWGQPVFWIPALGFTLFTGLVAGSYPAFYLSSFEAVKVLKGTFKTGKHAALPRQLLMVLQFTVSISLIIGTVIVYDQILYAKNRSSGYSRNGLLNVNVNITDLQQHYDAIRNDLIASGAAVDLGASSSNTTSVNLTQGSFNWEGKNPGVVPTFIVMFVSHDFGKTIGWQLKQGRDFSRTFPTDSAGMIVNEAAARYMGLNQPVGQSIQYLRSTRTDQHYRILGVVSDLLIQSPYAPVQPTIFMIDYRQTSTCLVKVNPTYTMGEALPKIRAVFEKYSPSSPFDYTFVDADYAKKFNLEERVSHLATFFAAFAIFISCLGLWGLASFMVVQRTKEIGIRKILGASVWHLWSQLSVGFIGLVLISFLLAVPLSWLGMHAWLQHYAYRISIPLWAYGLTLLLAVLIAVLTVSQQSIKAALTSPVKSLRSGE
jgi:ABC-type antimicrobial peptide transport system permease subunit